ncbi:hypothetical protein BJX70DRAFT_383113 [Aspergillus crustosus]
MQDKPLCPPNPSTTKKSLLVELLSIDWTEEDSQHLIQDIESRSKDISIELWQPSKADLQSVALQDAYRDSQANIYGLATAALHAGWSAFVVADDLTKR